MGRKPKPNMIREIENIDRPREKLLARGAGVLSDVELLSAILGSGCGRDGVIAVSRRLVDDLGPDGLERAGPADLERVRGIGPARACQLAAVLELGRRLFQPREDSPPVVTGPESAYALVRDLRNKKREHFVAIYLNARNALISREVISIGSLNASLVHPREVFFPAVREVAANIILAHNHPSGDVTPSKEDVDLTRRLVKAGELMGVEVLDHIVIGGRSFTSLKSKGLM
jgi:DNA repair protein RadC